MEKEIKVVVKVNNDDHALKICEDIYQAIIMRTTKYDISIPCVPEECIEKRFKNEEPSYIRERHDILRRIKK